ncbi:MAG: hypothetical protein ABJG33_01285 [Balneola sp.]
MILDPPQISEVLPQAKVLLDVASMQTILGGTGRVLVAKGDTVIEEFPSVDETGFAARIVLMYRNDSPTEFLDQTIPVYWNLRVDVKCSDQADPNIITDYIQKEAFKLLQDKTLTLSYAEQLFKVWRKTCSQKCRLDDQGWYYKASKWQTILTTKRN